MQRVFDIFISLSALILLSPLLLPVMLLLRLTGEGEVFFGQVRISRHGNQFKVLKFATMRKSSPNAGAGAVTLPNDPRVLPVGRILRKSKLNELPQLVNILTGEMSVIGPRPHTPKCLQSYDPQVFQDVISVRPGLSGLGSVLFRDEESMLDADDPEQRFFYDVVMPYKGKVDQYYVQNASILTYFLLIGLTFWVVCFPGSTAVWRFFPKIPAPPPELACRMGRQTDLPAE